MRRLEIPGGWYGENLPDGSYAALVPGQFIQTSIGNILQPEGEDFGPLFLRLTTVGKFKMAGQSHALKGVTWEYDGTWNRISVLAHGVSPVIYDRTGELLIALNNETYLKGGQIVTPVALGTQGFRYVDESNVPVYGDATFIAGFPPANMPLWEFTTFRGVTVGQGEGGADVIVDGKRRRIEDGDTTFIRTNVSGDDFAITIVKQKGERKTVFLWLNRSEFAQFPEITAPAPPVSQPQPPIVIIPPLPEQPKTVSHLDTLQRVRATYGEKVSVDEAVAILNEVAWTHRDEGFGLLGKPGGNNGTQPRTGVKCSVDWIVNRVSGRGGDCLVNGPDADAKGIATPTWNDGETFDVTRFVFPVEPVRSEPTTTPPSPNEPPPDLEFGIVGDLADIKAQLDHLVSIVANLVTVLSVASPVFFTPDEKAYMDNKVAEVLAAIKAQKYKASNRFIGTITLEPV